MDKKLIKQYLKETAEFNYRIAHLIAMEPIIRLSNIEIEIKILHDSMHVGGECKIPEHEHPFFELSFMRVGNMTYHCDGQHVLISEENKKIFFMPPATLHQRDSMSRMFIITGFQLTLNALDSSGKSFIYKLPKLLKKSAYCYEWKNSFGKLPELWRKEISSDRRFSYEKAATLIREFLISFFQEYFADEFLADNPKQNAACGKSRDIYLKDLITKIVDEKINSLVNINDIAIQCGMSSRHINRIFSENTGMSLGKYIISRKIENAKKMLQENTILVKDIASALAYNDTGYFCKIFKKATGMTPKKYSMKYGGKTT